MNHKNLIDLSNLSDEEFINSIITPYHYPIAQNSSISFGIKNLNEQIIICSNDYANVIGYSTFKEAMFKQPDVDYERCFGTIEQFNLQMSFLQNKKRAFQYIYKDTSSNEMYLTVTEPLLNMSGILVGKKEVDIQLKIFSHRELVEKHFKRYNIEAAALEDIANYIQLTEKEEVILFMLIGGYSQQEIGTFLNASRSYILKVIAESLCMKFELGIVSTKLLIEKAIYLGFANFIPAKFMATLNKNF